MKAVLRDWASCMKLRSWRGWSEWVPLVEVSWKEDVPASPGAYMIGVRRKLRRVVGVDEEGILGIGKATSLRNRLRRFLACAGDPNALGHMAGWRFSNHKMAEHFPVNKLLACWCPAASPIEAAKIESELIQLYISRHLEAPPLNYSVPWPQ